MSNAVVLRPNSPRPDLAGLALAELDLVAITWHDDRLPFDLEMGAISEYARVEPQWKERLTAAGVRVPGSREEWWLLAGELGVDPDMILGGRMRPRDLLAWQCGAARRKAQPGHEDGGWSMPMRVAELAARFGVSDKTMGRMLRDGKVPSKMLTRESYRVPLSELPRGSRRNSGQLGTAGDSCGKARDD